MVPINIPFPTFHPGIWIEKATRKKKRFSEFQGLRDHLSQSNGGNSPTRRGRSRFPSAGGLGGFLFGHDPNMIEQRRTELESYLNDSLRDSNALQSGILRTFLNLNSIPLRL